MIDWITSLLAQQDQGIDPFQEGLLGEIAKACRAHHLDFRVLDPIDAGTPYLDATGAPQWELIPEFQTMAGTLPPVLERPGIELDGAVLIKPRVKVVLPEGEPWEAHPDEPAHVASAFEAIRRAYARHRAEMLVAAKSNRDPVLGQIRTAFSALARALETKAEIDWTPWTRFVNGPFSEWISKPHPGLAAKILDAELLRRHPDGQSLLLPLPQPVFFHGFQFPTSTPVPSMGRLDPSPRLQGVLHAFLSSGMESKILDPVEQLVASGNAWWDPDLIRALIRAFSTHESAPTLDAERRRDLLAALERCGVKSLAPGARYVPNHGGPDAQVTYVWDTAPAGTVLQTTRTGFVFQDAIVTPFRGVVSLGPKPPLHAFLEQCNLPMELPEPDGDVTLERPESHTLKLLRTFFQNQEHLSDSERLDFVRALLRGGFDAKTTELISPFPKTETVWTDLTPSQQIDRLKSAEIDFELAATTSSVLATPSVEVLPGLRFERFQTFPIVSVCLPLSRDLARRTERPQTKHPSWRFSRAILEIAARNVLQDKDAFFQTANERSRVILAARVREAYLDYRSRLASMDVVAQRDSISAVDALMDQVAVHLEDGLVAVQRVTFPTDFSQLTQTTSDESHQIAFAFHDDVPAGQAITQVQGLKLDGELLAPAHSTYSLGSCPQWMPSQSELTAWATDLAIDLMQAPQGRPPAIEQAAKVLAPMRSGDTADRRKFLEMARFLCGLSDDFHIIGDTWESYAAHAAMSIADISVRDSDEPNPDLLSHPEYWPGLMFRQTPLLPIQGTVERARRSLERGLTELTGESTDAARQIRQCFDRVLGDPALLSVDDRLSLFDLLRRVQDPPDPKWVDAILEGSRLRRLRQGDPFDFVPDLSDQDAQRVHWVFDDRHPRGRVLTTVGCSIVAMDDTGQAEKIHVLSPLTVSAGPKWAALPALLDALKKCTIQSRDRNGLSQLEQRLGALQAGPDYRTHAQALCVDLLKVGYAPSVYWSVHRAEILDLLEQSQDAGFLNFKRSDDYRHSYVLSLNNQTGSSQADQPEKPAIVVTTPSGQHSFQGLKTETLEIPSCLHRVCALIQDRFPMEDADPHVLCHRAAEALVAALDALDPVALLEIGRRLGPSERTALAETFELTLVLLPEHTTDPALLRQRPWATYSEAIPAGEKSIHRFGYRLGETQRPLVWSESLGSLDSGIKTEQEIPLVLPFLYDFFPAFEQAMTKALGDEPETIEKIHGLIADWHQKLVVDFPQLPPTTLVSRIHKNIYQTVERWNLVPDDFRRSCLKQIQELYAAIQETHQEGGKRARVSLISCEPGHVIQPGEREQFETTGRKTPPAGSQADLVTAGLIILLEGRGDTIKAVVQLRAKT